MGQKGRESRLIAGQKDLTQGTGRQLCVQADVALHTS